MAKRILILLYVFHIPLLLCALNEPTGIGARCKGMGGVSVALVDFWAMQNNQAVMPFYGKMAAVGVYYNNQYLLKETSTAAAGFVFPVTKKNDFFGFSVNHYGGRNFGNLQIGFAYSKSFADVFSFGLQFDYLYNYFGDVYGSRSGFTFEIGMYGQVTPDFSLGFHVYNPARLKMITYNEVKEYIPTLLRLGMAYNFKKKCIVGFDIEKNLETKMQYLAGIEYIFADYFILRGGLRLPDFSFSLGMGTKVKNMKIDIASSYHTHLGFSPQITVMYDIK